MDYLYQLAPFSDTSAEATSTTEQANTESVKETLADVQNVLFTFVSAIGICANLFVITVILVWERYNANRTVANVFIVNLAFADFLFLVILPLHMPALQPAHGVGDYTCKIIEMSTYVNYRASILLLTTMSIDRYLAITQSLRSMTYRSRKNAIRITVVLWVVSVAAAVPIFVYAKVDGSTCALHFPGFESEYHDDIFTKLNDILADYSGGSGTNGSLTHHSDLNVSMEDAEPANKLICVERSLAKSTSYQAWTYSNFVIFFITPVAVIVLCYVCIAREATTRRVKSSNAQGHHVQVAMTIAVLVLIFIICWMPLQVWKLMVLPPGIEVAGKEDCDIIDTTFSMLAWMNSAINPILYSISNKRFRRKTVQAFNYMRYGYRRSTMMEQQSVRTGNTKLISSKPQQSRYTAPTSPQTSRSERVNPTYDQERTASVYKDTQF